MLNALKSESGTFTSCLFSSQSSLATQAVEDDIEPEGLCLHEAPSETISVPWFPRVPNENNEK